MIGLVIMTGYQQHLAGSRGESNDLWLVQEILIGTSGIAQRDCGPSHFASGRLNEDVIDWEAALLPVRIRGTTTPPLCLIWLAVPVEIDRNIFELVTTFEENPGGNTMARSQLVIVGTRPKVRAEGEHKNGNENRPQTPPHSGAEYSNDPRESTPDSHRHDNDDSGVARHLTARRRSRHSIPMANANCRAKSWRILIICLPLWTG